MKQVFVSSQEALHVLENIGTSARSLRRRGRIGYIMNENKCDCGADPGFMAFFESSENSHLASGWDHLDSCAGWVNVVDGSNRGRYINRHNDGRVSESYDRSEPSRDIMLC